MKTGSASQTDHKSIREGIKATIELSKFKKPTAHGQAKFLKRSKKIRSAQLRELGYDKIEHKHCLVMTENGARKHIKTAMMTRKSAHERNQNMPAGFAWCAVDKTFRIK